MPNLKIRKGDQVMVVTGKDAGKSGKVLSVDREKARVVVERINMITKHTRPNPKKNPQGGKVHHEAAIDASNVMVVCPACGQATRVGYHIVADGTKVRRCRRAQCGRDIDKA